MKQYLFIKTCASLIALCAFSSCATLESFKSVYDPEFDVGVEALAEELLSNPENRALNELAAERVKSIEKNPRPEILRRLDALNITPVRVPGLMYQTYANGGGDLVIMNYLFGRELPLIPSEEQGTVDKNAAIIADYVRSNATNGTRIALLSASKGSADAYTALMKHPDIGPRVAFWIDVVGLLEGTPLTNTDAPGMVTPTTRIPRETLHSFSQEEMTIHLSGYFFPPETLALHVVAFPLSGEITRPGRKRFKELKQYGPNDGYALLDAYERAPGRVYIVRGADHYLKVGKKTSVKMLALVQILLDELEEKAGQGGTETYSASR